MLAVVEYVPVEKKWRCVCDCGREKLVRAGHLRREPGTRTCGNHGSSTKTHGMKDAPEYVVWCNMRRRCHDPSNHAFKNYGGRGVVVCEAWRESFEAFFEHVGARPTAKHTLDRIDSEKGYEPGNVRWATHTEQQNNRRNNRRVSYEGKTMTLAEWARLTGVPYKTLWMRLATGWSFARAIVRDARGERRIVS